MINILYHTSFVKRFARKICVFSVILCILSPVSRRVFRRETSPFFVFSLTNRKNHVKYGLIVHILQICYIYLFCVNQLFHFFVVLSM